MTLILSDQGRPEISAVAQELLGQEIWVGWPHMVEAKVTKISNMEFTYSLSDKGVMQRDPKEAKTDFASLAKEVSERYYIYIYLPAA